MHKLVKRTIFGGGPPNLNGIYYFFLLFIYLFIYLCMFKFYNTYYLRHLQY